jgi:DNA polymerase-3 subunit alpha
MYLTAHPLDRFKLEIDSFCTTNFYEMSDLKSLSGKDFTFCGMVKSVRDGVDQWRNKPYLMAVLEDYTDAYTIRLKNDDYVNYKHYFTQEVALLIRGTVNEWRPREEPGKIVYSLKIKHIMMLADVREKMVKAVQLNIGIEKISEKLLAALEQFTVNADGKILKMRVTDSESNLTINMFSRNKQVSLTEEFLEFLENNSEINFRLVS